jgi:predicted DNA-binding transcriptional regulator AlpA
VDMVKLSAPRVDATGLCGEHPEFFLEAPTKPPEATSTEAKGKPTAQAEESGKPSAARLLTLNDVAAMCDVAPRTVNRWRDMGFCPRPLKMCKTVRWRQTDIEQWIADGTPDCRKTNWISATATQKDARGRRR